MATMKQATSKFILGGLLLLLLVIVMGTVATAQDLFDELDDFGAEPAATEVNVPATEQAAPTGPAPTGPAPAAGAGRPFRTARPLRRFAPGRCQRRLS